MPPTEPEDTFISDPAHYRELCAPFENAEAAQGAVNEFYAGVRALRDRLKLPDVVVVVEAGCKVPHGPATPWTEVRLLTCAHCGDALRVPGMLAKALSHMRAEEQQRVFGILNAEFRAVGDDPELTVVVATAEARAATEIAAAATARAQSACDRADAALARLRGGAAVPENSAAGANPTAGPPV